MAQMNISLPEGLKKWAEMRVAEGRYSSTSDLVRDLLRREQERSDDVAWVQAMVDEGMASETLEKDAFEVIDELIAVNRHLEEKRI